MNHIFLTFLQLKLNEDFTVWNMIKITEILIVAFRVYFLADLFCQAIFILRQKAVLPFSETWTGWRSGRRGT